MITIIKGLLANGMSQQTTNQTQQKPLKIRSMACLMRPAEFKERPLKTSQIYDKSNYGYVIKANDQRST
jgi:hypothetical protein